MRLVCALRNNPAQACRVSEKRANFQGEQGTWDEIHNKGPPDRTHEGLSSPGGVMINYGKPPSLLWTCARAGPVNLEISGI